MLDERLLNKLACPRCADRPKLTLIQSFLQCTKCEAKYPIVDDIPQLLPEDAIMPNQEKEAVN